MRCKIGVLSIGTLCKALIQEVNFLKLDADFVFSETLLYEGMELPASLGDADVIISSGYNARLLKKITAKPIVTIEPSLYDILTAYSKAIELDERPVVVFPLKQYTEMFDRISNILSVSIISDCYSDVAQLDGIIAHYKDKGYSCFIGSGLVFDEAERMGMRGVFVYPSESLREYIQLAYDTALALRKKTLENKFMSLAIDNTHSGMLFTNELGKILVCNQAARSLFGSGVQHPLIGQNILDIINENELSILYKDSIPIKRHLIEIGEDGFIISGYPIYLHSTVSNVMLTIDSVESIQNKERYIRKKLSSKGFVASYSFADMVSRNDEFNTMVQTAKKFSLHSDNILITGGTGSGKEVLAQSIHNHSSRADNAFVAVNCSAITETLLESELFGYDEGAFTGAKKGGKPGYFELAHGGSIFLDEIGELTMPMQTKLLRAIQEKQIIHVGGNKVITFDARVIAATNRNLWQMVCDNQFREDLYYRLAVLELNLPNLNKRKEDILPLFMSFIKKQDPDLALSLGKIQSHIEELLCIYTWPGNARELENFAKMISVTVSAGDQAHEQLEMIAKELNRRNIRIGNKPIEKVTEIAKNAAPFELFSENERIKRALEEAGGNYTKAAEYLGISRTTLWRKRKEGLL